MSPSKIDVLMAGPQVAAFADAVEREFNVHRRWLAADRKAFLAERAELIRGIATNAPVGASSELIEALPHLEIIASSGVGLDAIDLEAARRRGVIVTSRPGVLNECVADTGLMPMLAIARRLGEAERFVRAGRWARARFPLATSLGGKVCGVILFALLSVAATAGWAQGTYPTHQVTIVVPFPPGGGTDTGTRIIAQRLSQKWGQPVIVENKGGAAGVIGADQVAKAKPDGYTILMGNIGTQAINPSLYKKLPYDPNTAFAPITLVAELPLAMMVNPAVPAKTAAEFIALAKKEPGKLTYSSSGAGGGPHLAAEMFKEATGTFILHVPYRGGGPAVADLLAGHVQLSFMTVLEASGNLKSGKLRALAVTSANRVPALPDVPTLAESAVPGFNSISWIGLLAPGGTPKETVDKLSADIREVLAVPEIKARLIELGAVPAGTTPAQFQQLIDGDRKRYAQIIKDKNISID